MKPFIRSFLPAIIFLLLFAGGTLWTVSRIAPGQGTPPGSLEVAEMPGALLAPLSPEALEDTAERLRSFGGRFPGMPGHRKVQAWLEAEYRDNGLEVFSLPHSFAAPVTRRRELLDADQNPLPGVEIYPFPPNGLQPPATPPEGLTGELLLLTDEVFLARKDFHGVIGVLHMDKVPTLQGLNWTRYAQLGIQALILVHPGGPEAFPWDRILASGAGGMQSILPLEFPRVAASPALLNHLGETVTLHLTRRFEPLRANALVGVLRAPESAGEALVLSVAYDHIGILPDFQANQVQDGPLAAHVALLRALRAVQAELRRDVIFVATGAQYAGFAGLDELLRMIGPRHTAEATLARLREEQDLHSRRLAQTGELLRMMEASRFLDSPDETLQAHNALPPENRRFLDEQIRYVLNRILFEMSESVLERRMAYEGGDRFDLGRTEYRDFLAAQSALDDVTTVAGLPLARMMARRVSDGGKLFLEAYPVAARLRDRFQTLQSFHQERLEQLRVGIEIHRLFASYGDVTVFSPAFLSTAAQQGVVNRVGFVLGGPDPADRFDRNFRTLAPVLGSLVQDTLRLSPLLDKTVSYFRPSGGSPQATSSAIGSYPVPTRNWNCLGWKGITFVQTDRARVYRQIHVPDGARLHSPGMAPPLRFAGEFLYHWAKGRGDLPQMPLNVIPTVSGTVYASDVGRSMAPNFPLAGALLSPKPDQSALERSPSRMERLHVFTDPYGRYNLPDLSSPFVVNEKLNLQCVVYDSEGRITHVKDEGDLTQKLYPSVELQRFDGDFRNTNLVAFRAKPLAVLDPVNPQALRPFSSIRFMRAGSLSPFHRYNTLISGDGMLSFLPPDSRALVTFLGGSTDNELVQTVRSFMDGAPGASRGGGEIDGEGFRVWEKSLLTDIAAEQAQSMFRLNDDRIQLQKKRNLADENTLGFHQSGGELLEELDSPAVANVLDRIQTARDALTYSMIVHPILRRNIDDAVISILWYMGLLVPFMFFFEKLVFGFSDIRKQLLAQSVIFLTVFGLLRVLHPAFEMIRSSFMILLGFLILMISTGISVLFMGKFNENLEDLRKRRGQVSSAKVNTLGVLGTAFMLGLNNMHRRKVRTGLTCGTLVLITFAMICFTSIYNDFQDVEYPIGPAAYQGLLIQNEKSASVTQTERFAIESAFARERVVSPRRMLLGYILEREQRMPDLEIRHESAPGRMLTMPFDSIIGLGSREPLRHRFRFVSEPYWFDAENQVRQGDALPILIPESMAARLDIRVETVNQGGALVQINGQNFVVKGVFDEEAYRSMFDLDGRPLLPFDVRALTDYEMVPKSNRQILADENSPRVDPANIVIAPLGPLGVSFGQAEYRQVSVAIDFQDSPFPEVRAAIQRFLEMRARPVYYGLGDTSYLGSRMRVASFAGLVDLVIPLLIAALTVLNTMKGSVYERRNEIYVYNAVGIAPKFIFSMFFAEAFVYAVVGAVCGYLLSQGTGSILTALNLTGGLNMTFAGINTIYASLAVVAAVFLSTWFPAKSAMEIAAPAEESGWTPPVPDGDSYAFNLPFTFNPAERTAVLAFFRLYLLDHGEGGGGSFSAAPPRYGHLTDTDGSPVPALETVIWLQPFDLGVSQKMILSTPLDPETGSYVARMTVTRLTGTREAWMRVTHGFLSKVRRQFLHWRSVPPDQKTELRAAAREQMQFEWSASR